MEKPVPTSYNLNQLLIRRWSPRSFTSQPVDDEILKRLFEAARWAPSGSNEQPWRFLIGKKGTPTWEKIFETLVEFNQKWAKLAPVFILSMGRKNSLKHNKPNPSFQYDVGQSVAHLTLQAMHEGLFVHQMGGFNKEKAMEIFKIPADYEALTVIAIGHKGDPQLLEEDLAEMEIKPRERIALADLIYEDGFGKKSTLE